MVIFFRFICFFSPLFCCFILPPPPPPSPFHQPCQPQEENVLSYTLYIDSSSCCNRVYLLISICYRPLSLAAAADLLLLLLTRFSRANKGTKRGVQVHRHVAIAGAGGEGGGEERPVRGDGNARRQGGTCYIHMIQQYTHAVIDHTWYI